MAAARSSLAAADPRSAKEVAHDTSRSLGRAEVAGGQVLHETDAERSALALAHS